MSNTLFDLMSHAMENITDTDQRWSLCTDADFHKTALLGVIGLIGEILEKSQLQQHPTPYSSQDICTLGYFLQSAPELIRSMDALIDSCGDTVANNPEVHHA